MHSRSVEEAHHSPAAVVVVAAVGQDVESVKRAGRRRSTVVAREVVVD